MAKVIKKPKVIKIHQLIEGTPWPSGVQWDGTQMFVTTIQGVNVPISYGEWVMPEGDGIHFYPCSDAVLYSTYDFVED